MQVTRLSTLSNLADSIELQHRRVLVVDPEPEMLRARQFLLSAYSYRVRTACNYRDLYEVPAMDAPDVAVISNALGPFQLEAVAEDVRRRWPKARILVLGRPGRSLEDHLYDDAVDAEFDPKQFLAAVERCIGVFQ